MDTNLLVLIAIVFSVIVFLIGRAILLWYLRIDELVNLLTEIRDKL